MDTAEKISSWIRDRVTSSGARGCVFGLSGGLDSAVVCALCSSAVGGRALGVIMPCHSRSEDTEDALLVAGKFAVDTVTIDISTAYDTLLAALPEGTTLSKANLKPRLRMSVLYYFANVKGYLVVGTSNKSEISVGYLTKYGDGAADILPIADVYKTDLVGLARSLGVPEGILEKEPSAGLWEGQTDGGELGMGYDELDLILKALAAGKQPQEPPELIEKVRRMIEISRHKREPLPVCRLE